MKTILIVAVALYAMLLSTGTMAQPGISITSVPAYGVSQNGFTYGNVSNVNPDSYRVVVVMFVEGLGWFNKPHYSPNDYVPINPNGSWNADVTTGGGQDGYATRYCAYLIHHSRVSVIPHIEKKACINDSLPASQNLDSISVAKACIERPPKTLQFCNYSWSLKKNVVPAQPGNIYFSDNSSSIWVDTLCRLHLTIRKINGQWYGSEVYLSDPTFPANSKFIFQVQSPVGALDPNAILGLFTWDNDECPYHKELDIEFSANLVGNGHNGQFVVQPWDSVANIRRFTVPANIDSSTHIIEWSNNTARFSSFSGLWCSTPPASDSIYAWQYTKPISAPTVHQVRLNLWLYKGLPPTNGQDVEVIISQCGCGNNCKPVRVTQTPGPDDNIRLFPNPTTGTLTLQTNAKVPLTVSLYSVYGVLLQKQIITSQQAVLNLSQFPQGIYVLRLQYPDGDVVVKRILRQ